MVWGSTSLDDNDSSTNIFKEVNANDNPYLDDIAGVNFMESVSDMNLLTEYSETSPGSTDFLLADFDLVGVDDYSCITLNGQSRKRDTAYCPAGTIPMLQLPTLKDIPLLLEDDENSGEVPKEENEPDPSAFPRPGDGFDDDRCPSESVGFRLLDLCCGGPFGPFALDPYGRMVYRFIKACDPGPSRFPLLPLKCMTIEPNCRLLRGLSQANQCLLSVVECEFGDISLSTRRRVLTWSTDMGLAFYQCSTQLPSDWRLYFITKLGWGRVVILLCRVI